jgi:hypothetical protein
MLKEPVLDKNLYNHRPKRRNEINLNLVPTKNTYTIYFSQVHTYTHLHTHKAKKLKCVKITHYLTGPVVRSPFSLNGK